MLHDSSRLKNYGGANIDAICQRLKKAKEAFSIYNVNADRYYPEILDQFIDGTYQIKGFPTFDIPTTWNLEDSSPINLSDVRLIRPA